MVHELAGYDPDRIAKVLKWPLREALLCYLERLKHSALEAWRHDYLVWASIAPHTTKPGDAPRAPQILTDRPSDDEE
jgi:hypothetical protein